MIMIKRIELKRFKKYKEQSFELNSEGVTLLVGGNNAGKSTLIHAIAVWEFCKMILMHEKGRSVFNEDQVGVGDGLGMSAEEFLPIAVPTLNHLWTNLKTQLSIEEKERWTDRFSGYILRIKCVWDYMGETDKFLEIGLSLVNDRLFIRVTSSNIQENDHIITTVYLPTFAGVLPKESKVTLAERRAFLGRGMAGSVIRNMVYDLYQQDQKVFQRVLDGHTRMTQTQKKQYRSESPLQRLQENLRQTFHSELEIEPFNEAFQTVLRITERKLVPKENGTLEVLPKTKYTPRDIITQGSGYLQWLSIFCILYTSEIDVVLLDEPDAHLHASLQSELFAHLSNTASAEPQKQIFVSTHSVEMIKEAPLNNIYSMDTRKYLSEESSRVAVLHGIGSEYFPKIDLLEKYKQLIFVENESDKKMLSIWGEKCGFPMPRHVVYWATTESHATRRQIFYELCKHIPDLKCVSLRDRDMDNVAMVGDGLTYTGIDLPPDSPLLLLEWRRKNIESYCLCPKAIAVASGQPVEDIKRHFQEKFALAIDDDGFIEANPPEPIITLDGKHIFSTETIGLEHAYHCNKYDVAKAMTAEEVCEDIKTFVTRVRDLFEVE